MDFICRVELEETSPPIWRDFRFRADMTFQQLNRIVQAVMGWENEHHYLFLVDGKMIELPRLGGQNNWNARKEKVSSHVKQEGDSFLYVYDFGDDWKHRITVRIIEESPQEPTYPVCLGGERSCPPENAGGVAGYDEKLAVLSDKTHPDYADIVRWMPKDFGAEAFDLDEVNELLAEEGRHFVPKREPAVPAADKPDKPAKLTKSQLNKHLKQLDAEQLRELVKRCFETSKEAERMLTLEVLGESAAQALLADHKKKIRQEFLPGRGQPKLRIAEAKKAIAEYEKLTGDAKGVTELMLIYVESAVEFAVMSGYDEYRLLSSLISVYGDIIGRMNEEETEDWLVEFEERVRKIAANAEEVGWDFSACIIDLYHQLDQ
ncbi:DUF6155 family protein [Paenibacillus methanolicus]|uniref:PRiA4b ORF-3-like protein n=1 Tax=Paenibacillus methanolicus TaxID=582686 RepID=A0A5S5BY88_9BACL|nr:DUF6155 family protein [Paenibacillus methanolicus]TYP71100.1 pRiA4b ORF-3-like protein [Paenibacillus methanolicus]